MIEHYACVWNSLYKGRMALACEESSESEALFIYCWIHLLGSVFLALAPPAAPWPTGCVASAGRAGRAAAVAAPALDCATSIQAASAVPAGLRGTQCAARSASHDLWPNDKLLFRLGAKEQFSALPLCSALVVVSCYTQVKTDEVRSNDKQSAHLPTSSSSASRLVELATTVTGATEVARLAPPTAIDRGKVATGSV